MPWWNTKHLLAREPCIVLRLWRWFPRQGLRVLLRWEDIEQGYYHGQYSADAESEEARLNLYCFIPAKRPSPTSRIGIPFENGAMIREQDGVKMAVAPPTIVTSAAVLCTSPEDTRAGQQREVV